MDLRGLDWSDTLTGELPFASMLGVATCGRRLEGTRFRKSDTLDCRAEEAGAEEAGAEEAGAVADATLVAGADEIVGEVGDTGLDRVAGVAGDAGDANWGVTLPLPLLPLPLAGVLRRKSATRERGCEAGDTGWATQTLAPAAFCEASAPLQPPTD